MARPDFPYRKLPGTRHGILTGASLWLAEDHILHVKNTRFAEDYRRYYLNDIQAIYLNKTPRFLPPPAVVIGIIVGLAAQLFLGVMRRSTALEVGWFVLLALAAYAAWVCIFQSCACSIQTALGTDRLSCLHRVKGARAAIEQITNHVLQVQGPAEDYVQEASAHVAALEPVSQPRAKGQIFGWLTLPFVLISATIVLKLPVPIPDRSFSVALGTILAVVVLAVLALIAGRAGGKFRAMHGALLALMLVSGLELYTLSLVNTYSVMSGNMKEKAGAAVLTGMVWGAHIASRWLAGADIGAAIVAAVLLFRNPLRSNA